MGASFNYVIVPKKIQSHEELQKFYEKEKQKLYAKYGEDFDGYTGDMAVDNDELEIKENLRIQLPNYDILKKNSLEKDYDSEMEICKLIEGHAEKWGPSIAIRANEQWIICGFYSD